MRRRPGFTLLEALVAMAVFTLILGVCVALVVGLLDTHAAGVRALERTVAVGLLADQFRADVAAAEAAPPKAGEYVAAADTLILQRPGGALVVYRIADGEVRRLEPGAKEAADVPFTLGGEATAVEFRRDDAGRTLTLRWSHTRGTGKAAVRTAIDVAAVLGGDLR